MTPEASSERVRPSVKIPPKRNRWVSQGTAKPSGRPATETGFQEDVFRELEFGTDQTKRAAEVDRILEVLVARLGDDKVSIRTDDLELHGTPAASPTSSSSPSRPWMWPRPSRSPTATGCP